MSDTNAKWNNNEFSTNRQVVRGITTQQSLMEIEAMAAKGRKTNQCPKCKWESLKAKFCEQCGNGMIAVSIIETTTEVKSGGGETISETVTRSQPSTDAKQGQRLTTIVPDNFANAVKSNAKFDGAAFVRQNQKRPPKVDLFK